MPIEPGILLNKEEVLRRITQEEIFEKYLQLPVDESTTYHNPFRVDKNPSCRYYYKDGKLRFHDWGKFNWDCFSLVQFIYNCNFIEALRIIVRDFKLNTEIEKHNTSTLFTPTIKPRYNIKVSIREWNQEDINYWIQYGITLDWLKAFDVYPCKAIWINGEYFKCRASDPCYCYYFGNNGEDDLIKLYFPKRKKQEGRFFTNITVSDNLLQGYRQLPEKDDVLIITKSYKDVICLKTFGIYAVAPQSEYQYISTEFNEEARKRFKHIFCLIDNDNSGRRFGVYHSINFNISSFIFPWTMEKDFSDNVKRFGRKRMQETIDYIKKTNNL